MKLLRCIHSANPVGGGPINSVTNSTEQLQKLGHKVEVLCLDVPNSTWLSDFSFTIHALGPGKGSYGYSPRFAPWLRANAHRFDAVIVQGIWQYHSLAVWRVLHKSSTPYYVFTHGMLDPWFKQHYPLKHLKKCLYWPFGDYRVLRDAKATLFTSEEERQLARKSFRLYKCNEIVVNYGTKQPQFNSSLAKKAFLNKCPELDGNPYFLFLGRLNEKKGVDLLIKAYLQLYKERQGLPLHLVIAGPQQDAQYLQKLQALANASPSIHFTGMLTGNAKWGAFEGADAFILPSHQENFGIVVAEALAVGTPTLISNKINIWREVENNDAGFVQNDTLAGTQALLSQWLNLEHDKKEKMQQAAKQCFTKYFEITQATESLLKAIKQ